MLITLRRILLAASVACVGSVACAAPITMATPTGPECKLVNTDDGTCALAPVRSPLGKSTPAKLPVNNVKPAITTPDSTAVDAPSRPIPTVDHTGTTPSPTDIATVDRNGNTNYCKATDIPIADSKGNIRCRGHKRHGRYYPQQQPHVINTSGRVIFPPGVNYIDPYGNIILCEGFLIVDNSGRHVTTTCERDINKPGIDTVDEPVAPPPPPRKSRLRSDRDLPSDLEPL